MRKSKRHMLLLEVLIALSLVLLCLLPLLAPHIAMIQSEREFIRSVQLDRVVNQLFADLLITDFYNQRISWETIADKKPVPIVSEAVKALGYDGTYTISHKAPSGEIFNESKPFHLLEIEYQFSHLEKKKTKPLKYTFDLFVQREKPQEKTEEKKEETPPAKPPEVKPGE